MSTSVPGRFVRGEERLARLRFRAVSAMAVAVVSFSMMSVAAAADARFIGDLEADRDNWKNLIGISLVVEGRVSAVSRGTLRFVNSRLQVQLPPNAAPVGGKSYRIRGEMREGPVLPVFKAVSITLTPPDSEQLRVAQSRLKQNEPDGWLELADRFLPRALFYDDDALLREIEAVERTGIEASAAQSGNDPLVLNRLAGVAKERELNRLAAELTHRAARVEWERLKARLASDDRYAQTDVEILLDRVLRDLPGAAEAMAERRGPLETAYARDPKALFEKADDEQRQLLARLLVVEIVQGLTEARLDATASNADELASELEKRLPDRPDLAVALRVRGMEAAMAAVTTMTEKEVVDLAKRMRGLKREDDARRVILAWLESRRTSAEQRGAGALLTLAQDYERLAGDVESAVELYKQTLKADDRMIGAREALRGHGYEEVAGVWRKKQLPKPIAGRPAARAGEVEVGMSEEQVRGAFRTAPSKVNRIATFGEVTEIWVYADFGQVITLSRRGTDGEARVTDVAELDR